MNTHVDQGSNSELIMRIRTEGEFLNADIPYTPAPLLKSIIKKTTMTPASNVCVLFTVELLPILCHHGYKRVTIVTRQYDDVIAEIVHNLYPMYHYKTTDQVKGMKFDVVLTNPPYEGDIYKKFVEFATELAPEVAAITPSVFLTGAKGKNFRKFLAGKNVKAIDVLPIGLFKNVKDDGTVKDMLLSVSVTYVASTPQSGVAMSRAFGDLAFNWTDNFTELGDDLHYYLGEEGKSIFSKAQKFATKFDTSTAVQHKHIEWVGPNVNLTSKINIDYVTTPDKLANITGKVWTGKVVDAEGTWDAIRKKDTPTNKRYVYKTETAEQAINLGKWMDSRLFGVLLMMTGTDSNVSQSTVGKIPYIVLDGDYTDQRVYDLLGLTPAEVTWVENLGKQ